MFIVILFAFAAMFSFGISDFLMQRSSKDLGVLESTAFIAIIGSILLLPFVFLELNMAYTISDWIVFISISIASLIYTFLIFKSLSIGKLSIIEVVLESALPFTIILSIIFLREYISITQLLLIAGVFIGILLVSIHSIKDFRGKIERGVLLALIAGLLLAVDNVLTGYGAKNISPMMILAIPWSISAILSIIVLIKRKMIKKTFNIGKRYPLLIGVMCVLNVLGWIFYSQAIKAGSVSLTTPITECYVFVAIILGVIINKDKIKSHQIIGMLLAILCAIILATMI